MVKTIRTHFELADVLLVAFHATAIAVLTPYYRSVPEWPTPFLQSLAMIAAILFTGFVVDPWHGKVAMLLRVVFVALSCPWGYERANAAIQVLHGSPKLEPYVVAVDHALFGGNASEWAQAVHHPILTEWLQVAYICYFIIPLVVALFLMASKRWHQVPLLMLAVVIASHSNFVWYVLVPVRSPFLIAQLPEMQHLVHYDLEITGLWFTQSIRDGLLNATTMRYDCFPSGHTMLTTVSTLLAWRLSRAAFWTVAPIWVSIVFSTIYLRYHYLIDLVAAGVLAVLVLWAAPALERWWVRARAPAAEPQLAQRSALVR